MEYDCGLTLRFLAGSSLSLALTISTTRSARAAHEHGELGNAMIAATALLLDAPRAWTFADSLLEGDGAGFQMPHEALRHMRIICDLHSRKAWGSKSATSSPCRYAPSIIIKSTQSETSGSGGRTGSSIH